MKNLALALAFSFAASSLLPAQGKVWVVDDDLVPGVDFTDIQAAIDAASSGDMVLVHEGTYLPFTISGKGLSVIADEDASVTVQGDGGPYTTLVLGIAAGDEVVIRGIDFVPYFRVDDDTVRIESSQGVVWLEDVVLEWIPNIPFGYFLFQNQAMLVKDSDRVVLSNVEINGLWGAPPMQGLEAGSIALSAENSTVHLFDCDLVSGGTLVMSGPGRPGIDLDASFAMLRESRVTGGTGGEAGVFIGNGGNGGPGARVTTGSVLWSIGSQVAGGPGGGPGGIGGSFGAPGQPFEVQIGTVNEHAASDVRFQTQPVVRDDQLSTFVVSTEPNAKVFLLTTAAPDPMFREAFPGVVGVGLTPFVTKLGRTDGSGQLTFTTPVVAIGGKRDFKRFTFQIAAVTSTGVELSDPSIVMVIQDTF